ncbi:MAG: glycine--tRNA ligase [Acidimicrobiia bacterium]|nr:glycine--tRNA ligase [Acidimicrobiia bacterium]MYF84103.1 glycine--tRNA ligase [Acidimicrobiia bacterium]
MTAPSFETIVNLATKRGFVFRASEIYGGLRSAYDYGPLGVALLRNVKEAWWRSMVQLRDDVVGLDSAIIQSPRVWEASGHVGQFNDPLVECVSCHARHRFDRLEDPDRCPTCGLRDSFTDSRDFNLMFKTHMGPVASDSNLVYLRPETAQGIFTNFENVRRVARLKLPFGIAQLGKSFRNEITPGQFVFRTREFEQMEMEFFTHPDHADGWFQYWVEERHQWYLDLGMDAANIRLRSHAEDELAHYAVATYDVEYRFPWGWDELEGIANRTDFDLRQHSEASGKDLRYFDQAAGERLFPYVIEPAAGATRAAFAFLIDAYHTETVRDAPRTVLRLDYRLAPVKVAVLPLSKKPDLVEVTGRVADALRPHWDIEVDVTQAIGRRYRRQDEIGTPYCVTVDFDTLEDEAVTVRDRDTMAQDRVGIGQLRGYLGERLGAG